MRAAPAAIGGVCLVLAMVLGLSDSARLLSDYLAAFTFWLGLALGSLALALVWLLTGGRWGVLASRFFEAGAATLPLLAVLFVPILLGLPALYSWIGSADPSVVHKAPYLNVPFFVVRAVVYFVSWIVLVVLLMRWVGMPARLRRLGIIGLLVLGVTASFAAIDWWLSLEPNWSSTLYPAMLAMGELLAALAFAILGVVVWARRGPLAERVNPEILNDLGNLLLAFLMLWAYLSYFQYVLIWSGNLSTEIDWYVRRTSGGWTSVAWGIVGFGFVLPFALLLFRGLKRSRRWLGAIAALVIAVHLLEVFWLIGPAFAPAGPSLDWLQPLVVLGIGGLWLTVFRWRLGGARAALRAD